MQWSSEFATGIERLDEQHRMLFTMVGDFRLALDEGRGARSYGLLLGLLDDYARAHFEFEETCMVEYRCPAAALNHQAHAGFLRLISDHRTRYQARGFDAGDARTLVESLGRWLADHIGRIDTQLRDAVRGG